MLIFPFLLQIDPKPCNPRTLQKPKRASSYPKVFLGGLPSNVTETDLRSFFTRFGKVQEVVIMYDQEKKKSRGRYTCSHPHLDSAFPIGVTTIYPPAYRFWIFVL